MRSKASQSTLFWFGMFYLWMFPTASGGEGIPAQPEDMSLMQLSTEFKKIRKIRGHFNGGMWNNEVDQWLGRKHQIMLQLGKYFGQASHQTSEVIQYMGNPDQIVGPESRLFRHLKSLPQYSDMDLSASQFLVYQWRGDHDFFFFELRQGKLMASGWWYAGE